MVVAALDSQRPARAGDGRGNPVRPAGGADGWRWDGGTVTVGTGVVVGIAGAVAVAVVLAVRGGGPGRGARALRLAAAVATAAVAAVVASPAWRDSGAFAIVVVGVPLLCAAAALVVPLGGRSGAAAAWGAAVVMLGWSLLTALGLGGYFLVPSALMVAAAVAATPGRSRAGGSRSGRFAPGA